MTRKADLNQEVQKWQAIANQYRNGEKIWQSEYKRACRERDELKIELQQEQYGRWWRKILRKLRKQK